MLYKKIRLDWKGMLTYQGIAVQIYHYVPRKQLNVMNLTTHLPRIILFIFIKCIINIRKFIIDIK